MTVRAPQVQLDPELLPLVSDDNVKDPPVLHYGFVFPQDELEKIIARYNIPIEDRLPALNDHGIRECRALYAVTNYIREKLSFDLCIATPFTAKQDLYVVALDDTRRLRSITSKSWAKKARPVLRTLRRELRLEPSTQPMWYWGGNRGERYVPHVVHWPEPRSHCGVSQIHMPVAQVQSYSSRFLSVTGLVIVSAHPEAVIGWSFLLDYPYVKYQYLLILIVRRKSWYRNILHVFV